MTLLLLSNRSFQVYLQGWEHFKVIMRSSIARNIPLPLRDKVNQELDVMEAEGVISKVQQPTPWCTGMVVVKKKNGGVRICIDLKPLNRCVLREHHPLLKVDDILGQLTVATVFSKLDVNSGFWQVSLAEKSRLFITFITPFGRYCYNKLSFSILVPQSTFNGECIHF